MNPGMSVWGDVDLWMPKPSDIVVVYMPLECACNERIVSLVKQRKAGSPRNEEQLARLSIDPFGCDVASSRRVSLKVEVYTPVISSTHYMDFSRMCRE